MRGYSGLPADVQPVALKRLVRSDKSADHFRSVRDALLRFKRWSVAKFVVFRGYEADDAHVAWFVPTIQLPTIWMATPRRPFTPVSKPRPIPISFLCLSAHLLRRCAKHLRTRQSKPRVRLSRACIIFGTLRRTRVFYAAARSFSSVFSYVSCSPSGHRRPALCFRFGVQIAEWLQLFHHSHLGFRRQVQHAVSVRAWGANHYTTALQHA